MERHNALLLVRFGLWRGTLWIMGKSTLKTLETPKRVDKQKFEQVLARLIATPPIRSKELVGKSRNVRLDKPCPKPKI